MCFRRVGVSLFFLSLCLSPAVTCVAAPTGEPVSTLRVREAATTVRFLGDHAAVSLAVESLSKHPSTADVRVEFLDPKGNVRATAEQKQTIRPGLNRLQITIPFSLTMRSDDAEKATTEILAYRLRYRVSTSAQPPSARAAAEGIIALANVARDLFELQISTLQYVKEGSECRVLLRAAHPVTSRPVAGVTVHVELKADIADERPLLEAKGVTDARGVAEVHLSLPSPLPSQSMSLTAVGRYGGLQASVDVDLTAWQRSRVTLTTDKPLYQPGQTLHARLLAFSTAGKAISGADVLFRISDPESTIVFRGTAKTGRDA